MQDLTLKYIQFYPTFRCNLSCGFCFNRGISNEKEIGLNDFKTLVGAISDIGVRELDILGGEPTLHPDFIRLLDIAHKSGLKTTISTNGTNVKLLEEAALKFKGDSIKIGISLNSDVIQEDLHRLIIKYRPILKSIYKRSRSFPETAKEFLGLSDIDYYLLYMDVLSEDDLTENVPFYNFFFMLGGLKHKHQNIDGVFCGFIVDDEKRHVLQNVRCPAGTTKLSVMPDGSVYPCYLFFRHERFRLGNVLTDNFVEIWNHPILDYFRRFKGNRCPNKLCSLFSSCHGGCPSLGFIFHGDLDSPDPRCVFLKKSPSILSPKGRGLR